MKGKEDDDGSCNGEGGWRGEGSRKMKREES